ncbi:MAG: hypothetical protein OXU36_05710 [Candidatus Poribacteria bacterium]|nr:hypothetical protein [Candidatus Poribacteria bacterium]
MTLYNIEKKLKRKAIYDIVVIGAFAALTVSCRLRGVAVENVSRCHKSLWTENP